MDLSFLNGNNALFLEELYAKYKQDKVSVGPEWRETFELLEQNRFEQSCTHAKTQPITKESTSIDLKEKIHEYRSNGHFIADLNPLHRDPKRTHHDMQNLEKQIHSYGNSDFPNLSNEQIIEIMQKAHCGTIGCEFMHIRNKEEKEWLQNKLENIDSRKKLTKQQKLKIFQDVMEAELFEHYLHIKFPGAKRFSVEGAQSAIAALETIIEHSSNLGAEELLIGMTHRGRLNVLTKVMKKKYAAMLSEFQGNTSLPKDYEAQGDVKYHFGASCNRVLNNGKKIHLSLAANPSHLEAVNSVLMGKVRCKQNLLDSTKKALGIIMHGDAAFTGQGVVHECFNLNSVKSYNTDGILHIIINNQIGFTTNPTDSRGYHYPAYAAVAYEIPILHINGDDLEAVVFSSILATEYRYRFKKDIIVGIQCYRKYGHNEGDEPMFTQPNMYKRIAQHKSPMNIYAENLISENILTKSKIESMQKTFRKSLDVALQKSTDYSPDETQYYCNLWEGFQKPKIGTDFLSITGAKQDYLKKLSKQLSIIPDNIQIHDKVRKLLSARSNAVEKGYGIDWGNAEHLAFSSLLDDGINIRLAGQDSRRGTFSHRHSAIIDQSNEERYIPLNHIRKKQGYFEVIDSTLSEYAALGFEYGYSLVQPNNLVLWEAQFGDFVNGAQIIIDQFIASAETKWLQSSGLVLLLPHGYEGQGAEHSSARIERFLQLCAEDNMQIINCSTPSNYFHILRRQVYNNFRKPLIVFTPKSLLRHKQALSSLEDLSESRSFQPVIDQICNARPTQKLVLCSGKIYYDIMAAMQSKNIAIVRIEQLYPWPTQEIRKVIDKYTPKEIIWCQEEPKNMGAWSFINQSFSETLDQSIKYIGRSASASTASGYLKIHTDEQQRLIDEIKK